MSVFIAHKTADKNEANSAFAFLEDRGIDAYLAELDPGFEERADITEYLRKQINDRSDLLVLITANSAKSWWIPFETGIATQADKRIATVLYTQVSVLPDFLSKWPVIDEESEFETYADVLKQTRTKMINEAAVLAKSNFKIANAMKDSRQSDVFHELLKSKLGQ